MGSKWEPVSSLAPVRGVHRLRRAGAPGSLTNQQEKTAEDWLNHPFPYPVGRGLDQNAASLHLREPSLLGPAVPRGLLLALAGGLIKAHLTSPELCPPCTVSSPS